MANNKVLFRIQRFDPEKDEKPHDQDGSSVTFRNTRISSQCSGR